MVTDEMIEAFGNAFWSVNAASKIDGQREHIRSALEAALSTDAEPVAWRWRSTLFAEWNLSDKPPIDQRSMEQLMELNMEGLEWQALYAEPVKTAPAVAVKAKPDADDYLISTLESLVEDNVWSGWAIKQAIEIIRSIKDDLPYYCDACSTHGHGDAPCSPLCDRPALSAQVQDVAGSLTLSDLQAAHVERQEEWCPDVKPDLSFRGNELGGECGEAQNVIKKLERERHGWRGSRDTVEHLAEELADVIHCTMLVAITAGIDLEQSVVAKFNDTSAKNNLSTMLPASPASKHGDAE